MINLRERQNFGPAARILRTHERFELFPIPTEMQPTIIVIFNAAAASRSRPPSRKPPRRPRRPSGPSAAGTTSSPPPEGPAAGETTKLPRFKVTHFECISQPCVDGFLLKHSKSKIDYVGHNTIEPLLLRYDRFEHYRRPPSRPASREQSVDRLHATGESAASRVSRPPSRNRTPMQVGRTEGAQTIGFETLGCLTSCRFDFVI